MQSTFRELIRSLSGSRDGVVLSIQSFAPVDVEQLANKLHLDARARENGERNQPPPDSDTEDVAEREILAQIEILSRKAEEEFHSQLDLYDARIRRALHSGSQGASIDAAGQSAIADFIALTTVDLNRLHTAVQEVKGRQHEFDEFRTANKLVRLPDIVSPREQVYRWSLIAVFVMLESIFNGLFFAKGSETGIIGGVLQALVLSSLNVGVALLCGKYCLPRLFHVHLTSKLIGALATIIYSLWAPGFNLLVGHFRDLFIETAAQVSVPTLLDRFWSASYFLPSDTQSLLLAALGMGLSVLSLIDAFGMDDLYPGYGAVGRRRVEAITAYSEHKEQCLERLASRRDTAIAEMLQIIELIHSAEYDLTLAVDGRSRLYSHYRGYLKHLGGVCERLLARYQEANMSVRSLPPPKRFHRPPVIPVVLIDPELPPIMERNSETSARVIGRLDRFIKQIHLQFEDSLHQYETVENLTGETDTQHASA